MTNSKKSVSSEVTATTTKRVNNISSKAEHIKQRAEDYFKKMNSLKENIEESVRPMAEFCYKFEDDVNRMTFIEEGLFRPHLTADEIMRDCATGLCKMIMNSRVSLDERVDMLERLDDLISYCKGGGLLTVFSADKEKWDGLVRDTADERIEKYESNNIK